MACHARTGRFVALPGVFSDLWFMYVCTEYIVDLVLHLFYPHMFHIYVPHLDLHIILLATFVYRHTGGYSLSDLDIVWPHLDLV